VQQSEKVGFLGTDNQGVIFYHKLPDSSQQNSSSGEEKEKNPGNCRLKWNYNKSAYLSKSLKSIVSRVVVCRSR